MHGRSRALVAGILCLGIAVATAVAVQAAPLVPAAAAVKGSASAQTLADPVHYRCVVRRCGPYRCVWINRCRRW